MGKIIILDENTSNKIAAGEVIERPASIIKELVENSIDAGADIISIEIKNGGISYIKVTDNGSGIDEDDAVIAFDRHATSKIRNSTDLECITTLGFRGEALASIAAVSSVELTSRVPNNPHGTYVKIQGGNVLEVKKIGCPVGTTFVIRELFYNTPARFKFLKKDSTEAGYISDVTGRIALGNPNISFRLVSNGSTVLHTPGNGDLLSVIYSIYGKDIAKNCIEIKYKDDKTTIYGYAGKQEIARNSRNHQSIFVNRRYVKSRTVTSAIDEAYKTLLMKNKYPFIVLFIDINPMLIDVNVHPAKMEIKFSEEQEIFRSVFHAVNNALIAGQDFKEISMTQESTVDFKIPQASYEPLKYTQEKIEFSHGHVFEKKYEQFGEKQVVSKNNIHTEGNNSKRSITKTTEDIEIDNTVKNSKPEISFSDKGLDNINVEKEPVPEKNISSLRDARIVGQVFSTYIILQNRDEMLVIDQHAAHERITYEKLKQKYMNKEPLAQYLLNSEMVQLTHQEYKAAKENKDFLESLGFIFDDFGNSSVLLRAVPVNDMALVREVFLQVIDDIMSKSSHELRDNMDDALYSIACKAAVKANRRLDDVEIQSIVDELGSMENPFTCPHGRPTVIRLSKRELEKMFKRII